MSVYKVYVENSCIRFVPEGHAGDGEPSLAVAPGESVSMTKLLQKLQFTKKLTVISEKIESVFGEFRASMPLIEAGGGLVSDAGGRVLIAHIEEEAIRAGINSAILGDMLTTVGSKVMEDMEKVKKLGFTIEN